MRTANLLTLLLSFVLVHCLAPTRFSANAIGLDVSAKPPKDHPKDTVDTHATSGSMTKGDSATKGHGDSKGHGDGPEGHWEWKPDPESTDHANVYPNGKGHSKDHHNVHPSDQASCQISCKNNYKFFHTSYKLSFTGCGGPDGNERELHESIKGGACATTFWKWDGTANKWWITFACPVGKDHQVNRKIEEWGTKFPNNFAFKQKCD